MKAIKHVLFVDKDDRSLSPLFEAIVQQPARTDSVLSTAGLILVLGNNILIENILCYYDSDR